MKNVILLYTAEVESTACCIGTLTLVKQFAKVVGSTAASLMVAFRKYADRDASIWGSLFNTEFDVVGCVSLLLCLLQDSELEGKRLRA